MRGLQSELRVTGLPNANTVLLLVDLTPILDMYRDVCAVTI
jgi:hypothetical protein